MKILIIEDDSDCGELLREYLSSYGTCHLATSGAEALIAVDGMLDRKDPYRLIWVDSMIAGRGKKDVLKKIRELERQRRIGRTKAAKIIMTTAMGTPKKSKKALVYGASGGYLTKPVDLNTMRKLLTDLGVRPLAAGEAPA